jgi:hypothetical protein
LRASSNSFAWSSAGAGPFNEGFILILCYNFTEYLERTVASERELGYTRCCREFQTGLRQILASAPKSKWSRVRHWKNECYHDSEKAEIIYMWSGMYTKRG